MARIGVPTGPEWLKIARAEIGVKEIPGPKHHPRILDYLSTVAKGRHKKDEIPWCSAFVNWCMIRDLKLGTDEALARSWLQWGKPLDIPQLGCIVVMRRGTSSWQGHVGFWLGELEPAWFHCLGGNQKDSVRVSRYATSKVLGYRWPEVAAW